MPEPAIAEADLELPPKPEQPLPGECCERGCENCVWIYYERALKRWKQKCKEITRKDLTVESPSR
jgi:hypothetical protein